MRHNRRAVMAEQYKLYMKKNIFNGRYFVRNIQLVIGMIITIAVLLGVIFLIKDKNDSGKAVDSETEISAKEALFGSSDSSESSIDRIESAKEITSIEEIEDAGDIIADVEITKAISEISDESDSLADVNMNDEDQVVTASSEDVPSPASNIAAGTVAMVSEANAIEEEEAKALEEAASKSEFDDRCIANVDESLNIRKEPSPDAEFVGMMQKGSIARVIDDEGDWTKIKSGDVEGYVLSEFILTGKVAEKYAENFVTLQGTAIEDGVNIREDRSTDANILQVLDKYFFRKELFEL